MQMNEAAKLRWTEEVEKVDEGFDGLTRKDNIVAMMEQQSRWCEANQHLLKEAGPATNVTGDAIDNWSPVLIKMVKRLGYGLVAMDFFGVQPLNAPDGLIFAMRVRSGSQTGPELFYNEPNTALSGTGTQAQDSSSQNALSTYGTGMATSVAETLGVTGGQAWAKLAVSIEKQTVTAKSRGLFADYSDELRQDMQAVHGLNVDSILAEALVTEIQGEMNREFIRTMNTAAKKGGKKTAQGITGSGTFDLEADTDGRWFLERLKYFLFQLELDANDIARDTRRGKGNRLIASANFASALAMAGLLDYSNSNLDGQKNLSVDVTGQTFAGVLANGMRVYVDPYAELDYYNVAYKGPTELDAGIFYAPYTPIEMKRAVGEDSFQNRMAFKTRYGIVANPFYMQNAAGTPATGLGLGRNENGYFRASLVTNLY